uniref:helicase-related protein n=1 Tax=Sphingorhabdus sp. Alg239-R122 TaxID=2305989 RepID=UPI0013DBA4B2
MSSGFHPHITAVLGPTNTGKTHLAIERMCGHSSGAIGFPLRLLAREVYDRVRAIKGDHQVALVTGEERIVPPGARWFLATMESLPMERDLAFMGIDEAQLGADPERGHVFTDRMLHARGREETMVMGSETLRPMVDALEPDAEIITRPRFSTLSYAGVKKLSRLPPRSAIVAFSVEEVYAVAEMLRRFRGGAAVVMGALSPHTRNKQVEMFQNGEVDYLVATDAIGMGLNMDVDHIAFASLRKFDGRKQRRLHPHEIAQIAGRAGRHQRDGTFGTLAGERADNELLPEEVEAVEEHRFAPLSQLYWRESGPRMTSLETLLADLERKPQRGELRAAPETVDLAVLRTLAANEAVAGTVKGKAMVSRFWAACSLPDFRKLGAEHHARFVAQLWQDLSRGHGHLPHSFMARKITELDNVQGDVDVLAGRIAAIRTWAYIAQRPDWLANPAEMADRARSVEQKLSDALHNGLAQRFVDRRTTVLMRQLGKDASLLPVTLDENNVIKVDDEAIGTLSGFEFVIDADAKLADRKMLLAAAEKYLGNILAERAKELCGDEAAQFSLQADETGRVVVVWRENVIAAAEKATSLLMPRLVADRSLALLDDTSRESVVAHVSTVTEAHIAKALEPLMKLENLTKDENCPAQARALYVQLIEGGGTVQRAQIASLLQGMDAEARQKLRQPGIVVGSFSLFMPHMIKPLPQEVFAMLSALYNGRAVPDASAIASFAPIVAAPETGGPPPAYLAYGSQWLRVDMSEKLIRAAHQERSD